MSTRESCRSGAVAAEMVVPPKRNRPPQVIGWPLGMEDNIPMTVTLPFTGTVKHLLAL